MDFFDSEPKDRKSHRVRSWYLYEQYKSLERNQLDAVQKLRDKSYQDKILRQELHERKARRKLYEHSDLSSHSDCRIQKSVSEGNKSSLSASSDDFLETFCELIDDKLSQGSGNDTDTEECYSQDDSQIGQRYLDEFESLDNLKDDQSYAESVNSVVEISKYNEGIRTPSVAQGLKNRLKDTQYNIAEELNQQLEAVKDNIICLGKYSYISDENDDKLTPMESSDEEHDQKSGLSTSNSLNEIDLNKMWLKLVSFAYEVIDMNHHGNCYSDYGSQFLTAVLACDVLRRGLSRVCDILQPYVSPIKYVTDDIDECVSRHYIIKKKNVLLSNKSRSNKAYRRRKFTNDRFLQRKHSTDFWRESTKFSCGYKNGRRHLTSRTSPGVANVYKNYSEPHENLLSSNYSKSMSRKFLSCDSESFCSCRRIVTNPMLKIGQYIDALLQDVQDLRL